MLFSQCQKNIITIKNNNAVLYAPVVHNNKKDYNLNYNDYVMEINVDITKQLQSINSFKNKFIFLTFFIILFLIITFFFINKNITKLINYIIGNIQKSKKIDNQDLLNSTNELGIISNEYNKLYDSFYNEINKNKLLLNENKQFIADMVHQIRTPLSVIMMNSSLIEINSNNKVNSFLEQINSSINMLSNSYEDLAYIISHDTVEYKPKLINLTNFLVNRIKFFDQIASANFKNITYQISSDIYIYMNDIELERLIDNNISNAIKHSRKNSEISIYLNTNDENITLSFESYGKAISNIKKIFEKNYSENNAKRSLGLGLYMVKIICGKNNISYTVASRTDKNSFLYELPNSILITNKDSNYKLEAIC